VNSLPDVLLCDFVLLIDAFDALILAPEEHLLEVVLGMEQRLGVNLCPDFLRKRPAVL